MQQCQRGDAAGLLGREELERLEPHADGRRHLSRVDDPWHNRHADRLRHANDLRIKPGRNEEVRARLLRGRNLLLEKDRPGANRHVGVRRANCPNRIQRPRVTKRHFDRRDSSCNERVRERNGRRKRRNRNHGKDAAFRNFIQSLSVHALSFVCCHLSVLIVAHGPIRRQPSVASLRQRSRD